ncbi:hypothetical protein [Actinoallomurus acaciae]|uniref:Uncharacterized protein n=1 Tax=Actinoallomurus acaciae TaxID=502577 RepID=A0ABV5YEF2_9ACTN
MAEARNISGPELKERYRVTVARSNREKLNEYGYIKSWKEGQAYVHELEDKGWDRVHQQLNFDSPKARALGAALSVLHDNLRERVLEHGAYHRFGEMFTHAAAAPVDDLETRIRVAYESLAPRPRAWLRHTDVRRKLADVPGDALDQAFRALSQAEDVDMMPESNQKTLTPEDRRNAVRVGGQDTHLIAIGTR